MTESKKKTIGTAIDEIVTALEDLEDGPRVTAVRAACEHLGIDLGDAGGQSGTRRDESQGSAVLDNIPSRPVAATDIRTFKESKQPTTATEMACIVAYYLESMAPVAEHKSIVATADMEKYFKQAGYRLPKHMAQLLVDAKAAGYLDSAGRAKYKLNPVGHNLVVHGLPKSKK